MLLRNTRPYFRDGQLKRSAVKKEWKEKQQEEFSKRLKVE